MEPVQVYAPHLCLKLIWIHSYEDYNREQLLATRNSLKTIIQFWQIFQGLLKFVSLCRSYGVSILLLNYIIFNLSTFCSKLTPWCISYIPIIAQINYFFCSNLLFWLMMVIFKENWIFLIFYYILKFEKSWENLRPFIRYIKYIRYDI